MFFSKKTSTFIPVNVENKLCPNCGGQHLNRVSRRVVDKLISPFVPLKRYRCSSCRWEGNLVLKPESESKQPSA